MLAPFTGEGGKQHAGSQQKPDTQQNPANGQVLEQGQPKHGDKQANQQQGVTPCFVRKLARREHVM